MTPPDKPRPRRYLRVINADLLPAFVPAGWEPTRGIPTARSECRDGPRPCPYLACRFHLWVVVGADRAGRPYDGRRPPPVLRPNSPASCVLDLVGDHPEGMSNRQIAEHLGVTDERVRQIARGARRKLLARLGDE